MPPAPVADRYELVQPLGEGGMGSVWLARDQRSGNHVAVKFLRPDLAPDPTQRARFFREAYAAASLRNDHIVQVFEVGALPDGVPFLVMEYLQGLDLGALLDQRGPFPLDAAVGYVAQACVGLAAVHAAGIIHRDLKPQNLLLLTRPDGSPLVKVLDFGVARASSSGGSLTAMHTVVGSPQCMAPEQYDGRSGELTAAADVWALGCILYKLLEGRYPYEGETLSELLVNLATMPMRPFARPDIPEGLKGVIGQCLQLDPTRRFTDARGLREALLPWAPEWARAGGSAFASTDTTVPVGTAPMAGAELAVEGGKRKRWGFAEKAMAVGCSLVLLVAALVVSQISACGYILCLTLPGSSPPDLEETLKIADLTKADPVDLLPQVEVAMRKLDAKAVFLALSTSVRPPELANTSSQRLTYMFRSGSGHLLQGVVEKDRLTIRRTAFPSKPPPLGTARCTLAGASRAAHAAGLGKRRVTFYLGNVDRRGLVWQIDSGALYLDGRTCARVP